MARRANQRDRGAIHDRRTGVLLARKNPPLAHIFTAIPLTAPDYPGSQLPGMNFPTEYANAFAVHLENLYPGLPLPSREPQTVQLEGSRYRLVNPTGGDMPMGGNGELWLPWQDDEESVGVEAVMPDPDGVPDVNGFSEAQLRALEQQIDQRRADEARLRESDKTLDRKKPEWVEFREGRQERLTAQQQADRDRAAGGDAE